MGATGAQSVALSAGAGGKSEAGVSAAPKATSLLPAAVAQPGPYKPGAQPSATLLQATVLTRQATGPSAKPPLPHPVLVSPVCSVQCGGKHRSAGDPAVHDAKPVTAQDPPFHDWPAGQQLVSGIGSVPLHLSHGSEPRMPTPTPSGSMGAPVPPRRRRSVQPSTTSARTSHTHHAGHDRSNRLPCRRALCGDWPARQGTGMVFH
jgi:hypothetical protein